VPGEMTAEQR